MEAASLNDIKKELKTLNETQLMTLCLRLGRFKKENKELLTYLLFEQNNEDAFIENIKIYISNLFYDIHKTNLYSAKKSLRKILRSTNKFIRYSGNKKTEVELLLHFCHQLVKSGIQIYRGTTLSNLWDMQIKKINKAVSSLHEDLQFDYKTELENLNKFLN